MPKAFTLGYAPISFGVLLPRHGSFVAKLTNEDGDWAPGTTIVLNFYADATDPDDAPTHSWPATITGADADWNVPAADVADVILEAPQEARLIHTIPPAEPLVWGIGELDIR
jgi:hypothetical protein